MGMNIYLYVGHYLECKKAKLRMIFISVDEIEITIFKTVRNFVQNAEAKLYLSLRVIILLTIMKTMHHCYQVVYKYLKVI